MTSIAQYYNKLIAKMENGTFFTSVVDRHLRAVEKDAKEGAKTTRIAENIFITPAIQKGSTITATIGIKIGEDEAPEGRAYELGSGLHGAKKAKYLIKPKGEGYPLRFIWLKNPGFAVDSEGKVSLMSVQHPGVEAHPTLKPAMEKNRENLFKFLRLRTRTVIETEFREQNDQ